MSAYLWQWPRLPAWAYRVRRYAYARDHNHPLTELAGDVIRGTARIAGGK